MSRGAVRLAVVAVVGLAALALLPFFIADPFMRHLAILALLFAVVASNWDLTLGYAGLFNFAHLAFFATGAYAWGIVTTEFGWSPWVGIAAAMGAGAIAAAVAFLPILRLRGIYVALITFAFSQLCLNLVLSQPDLTGGRQGLVGVAVFAVGDYRFTEDDNLGYYWLAAALFVACLVFLRGVVRSNLGLSVVALRDFEDYAISRGVSVSAQRLKVFVLSAPFTAAAGAVYGSYLQVVSPELFDFGFASLLLSMVLVGGVGTIYGPAIGAIGLTIVSENIADWGEWRFIAVGVLIIAVMRFLPSGVWGWGAQLAGLHRSPTTEVGSSARRTAVSAADQGSAP